MGLKTLAGLWKRTAKSGKAYYSGKVRERFVLEPGTWVQLHKNANRRSDDDPEYNIVTDVQEDER